MGLEQRKEIIAAIEKHRGSHLICCLTSDRPNAQGSLAKDFIPVFYEHLKRFPDHERVEVFMFTLGGDTLAAFGLSRLIREFTSNVGVLIPQQCHSGGTLFALGANQIYMARLATLSPIDPSVTGPLNPALEMGLGQKQLIPVSVESVAGYKALVKEDWGLEGENAAMAFRLLAEKINPIALGNVFRSRQQIARLADKLIGNHRRDKKQIKKIIDTLTRDLGSHDYPIAREEARHLLGKQIADHDKDLEVLLWDLYKDFSEEMELGKTYDAGMAMNAAKAANQATPLSMLLKVVTIESVSGNHTWERHIRLTPFQMMTQAGPVDSFQQGIVFDGWRNNFQSLG